MPTITPPDTSDTKSPDTNPADRPGATSGASTRTYLIGAGVVIALIVIIGFLTR